MEHLYLNDYGVELKLDAGTDVDLSLGSNPRIYYQKPNGTTGFWTATVSTRYLVRNIVSADFDQTGVWKLHGYIESDGPIHGDAVSLRVLALYAQP